MVGGDYCRVFELTWFYYFWEGLNQEHTSLSHSRVKMWKHFATCCPWRGLWSQLTGNLIKDHIHTKSWYYAAFKLWAVVKPTCISEQKWHPVADPGKSIGLGPPLLLSKFSQITRSKKYRHIQVKSYIIHIFKSPKMFNMVAVVYLFSLIHLLRKRSIRYDF